MRKRRREMEEPAGEHGLDTRNGLVRFEEEDDEMVNAKGRNDMV